MNVKDYADKCKNDSEAKAERWNAVAPSFQEVFKKGKHEYNEKFLDFLFSSGMMPEGGRVADVGCGVGKYGTYFAEKGCAVTLIDISPDMLKLAEQNMSMFSTSWQTVLCDLDTVEQEELDRLGKHDLVISTMSPAVHDENTVKKMSSLTDRWCVVTTFAEWKQPDRDRMEEVAGVKTEHRLSPHRAIKENGILEVIENAGFKPEVKYAEYDFSDLRTPDEMAQYYIRHGNRGVADDNLYEKIKKATAELIDDDGLFHDRVNATAAWIYWKTSTESR